MRTFFPKHSTQWTISRERYAELKNFCLQYPGWKLEAADALMLSSPKMDGMPRGTDISDPTARSAERREAVTAKIAIVERSALQTDGGAWYQAIILNVCNNMPYEVVRDLHPTSLKNNNRTAYFNARRRFFQILDKERDKVVHEEAGQ